MPDSVQTDNSLAQTQLPDPSQKTELDIRHHLPSISFPPVISPGRTFIAYPYAQERGDKIPTRWDIWPRSISNIKPITIPFVDDIQGSEEHSGSLETAPNAPTIEYASTLLSDAGALVDQGPILSFEIQDGQLTKHVISGDHSLDQVLSAFDYSICRASTTPSGSIKAARQLAKSKQLHRRRELNKHEAILRAREGQIDVQEQSSEAMIRIWNEMVGEQFIESAGGDLPRRFPDAASLQLVWQIGSYLEQKGSATVWKRPFNQTGKADQRRLASYLAWAIQHCFGSQLERWPSRNGSDNAGKPIEPALIRSVIDYVSRRWREMREEDRNMFESHLYVRARSAA